MNIKYRVWCKVSHHYSDQAHLAAWGGQLLWLHTGNQISISDLNDYVIQRYTGLNTETLVPLYEGDIINLKQNRYVIEYDDQHAKFVGRGLFYGKETFDLYRLNRFAILLGNIFETPDYLSV